jgi:nitrate/TMAO reductase-like tetraheme cytochrome c subunit
VKTRSKKRQDYYRNVRIPLVKRLLDENPVCARCHSQRAVDVHEIKTRARGGSLDDERNLACLCRPCHTVITDNPKRAREEGWVKQSWE